MNHIPMRPSLPLDTHKGEYGKIIIVGGSIDYYGAPILTALGAENSGADLITICLPSSYILTAQNYSLNFFLKPFKQSSLSLTDAHKILDYSEGYHVLAIGNGLGKTKPAQAAVLKILSKNTLPVVIDAEALFPEILKIKTNQMDWILTPHKKEFERIFKTPFSIQALKDKAKEYELTILVKGPIDYIASKDHFYENKTGCVQMKVGGTGDVLAGIIASYRSQGLNSFDAAKSATYYYGKSGEILAKDYNHFSASTLAKAFSHHSI